MNGNPDPKPGRWILPLIIIAMVGFTYVFVSSLEEQVTTDEDAGLELPALETTSTTVVLIDTTTTTEGPTVRASYAQEMSGYLTELKALAADFQAINTEFEEKAITYSVAETGMESKITELQAWHAELAATIAPPSEADLQLPHQDIIEAALTPVVEAEAALEGLRGPTAEPRVEAVIRFADAIILFEAKINAAVAIAGS